MKENEGINRHRKAKEGRKGKEGWRRRKKEEPRDKKERVKNKHGRTIHNKEKKKKALWMDVYKRNGGKM